MKIAKVLDATAWEKLPRRQRSVSPAITEIVDRLESADEGLWVVVELDQSDKRRLQTIRKQITAQAALRGIQVKIETRGGSMGVQKAS